MQPVCCKPELAAAKHQCRPQSTMIAESMAAHLVDIRARFDPEISRHEHVVEPPRLASRDMRYVHGAVSVSLPVGMPKPVFDLVLE